jgi:hypothetical protein
MTPPDTLPLLNKKGTSKGKITDIEILIPGGKLK